MTIRKYIIFVSLLLNVTAASGCGQLLNATVGSYAVSREAVAAEDALGLYEITDIDKKTDSDEIIKLQVENLVSGTMTDDYSFEEGILTIQKAGAYELSGKTNGCRIVIRVYDDEIVQLLLNGVELNAAQGPVIYVERAGKVLITSREGTSNIISDSPEYEDDKEACIFSNADLTLNGEGELNVYGYYHDAIRSKDRIKAVGAKLYVRAKNNGIRGNDGVFLSGSSIVIESEGTGILAKAESDFVVIKGGSCKVTAGENAVSATDYVSISDCEYDLYAVKEAVRCSGVKEIDE